MGKWRKWELYPEISTDYLRVKSRTMRFLTYLHFFVTHTLKWAGLTSNSSKLEHSLQKLNLLYYLTNIRN